MIAEYFQSPRKAERMRLPKADDHAASEFNLVTIRQDGGLGGPLAGDANRMKGRKQIAFALTMDRRMPAGKISHNRHFNGGPRHGLPQGDLVAQANQKPTNSVHPQLKS